MEIRLYTGFEKKNNSTKKPDNNDAYITLTGDLKEPCSVINPIFAIKRLQSDIVPYVYTYAYISAFGRYYFVKDWSWRNALWECQLEVDVLATYRNNIGSATEYILRTDSSSTGLYNGAISDSMYPTTTSFQLEDHEIASDPFQQAMLHGIARGTFVVGILSGDDTDAVGAVSYYAFTSTQFGIFKDKLFSDDNLEIMHIAERDVTTGDLVPLITDMSIELLKTMYNPYQYVVSCMWFPFIYSDIPQDDRTWMTSIKLGWWDYPVQGWRLKAQVLDFSHNTAITPHPLASTRGSYLNYAPFTRRMLTGRLGQIPIDTSYLKTADRLSVIYKLDIITGNCKSIIEVFDSTAEVVDSYQIYQKEFLLGVPIQIAQVGVDYLGTMVSSISTGAVAGQQALSLNVGGAVSTLANGIYNTVQCMMPQVETSGANGSFIASYSPIIITSQFLIPVDEDITHKGRPLCQPHQINTLSGFVLCAEGDFDISCLDDERKMIKNYLTSGFFWE